MPRRKPALTSSQIYHIFNTGLDSRTLMHSKEEYRRLDFSIRYYAHNPAIPLSKYLRLPKNQQAAYRKSILQQTNSPIDLLAYCLMSNHFHLLVRQNQQNAISHYLQQIQTSHSRACNLRHNRQGPLIKPQFGVVHIRNSEQLLYTARYIHLNPYSAYVANSSQDILDYPWSSLPYYCHSPRPTAFAIETNTILSHFSHHQAFIDFTLDYADHQRQLVDMRKNIPTSPKQ